MHPIVFSFPGQNTPGEDDGNPQNAEQGPGQDKQRTRHQNVIKSYYYTAKPLWVECSAAMISCVERETITLFPAPVTLTGASNCFSYGKFITKSLSPAPFFFREIMPR